MLVFHFIILLLFVILPARGYDTTFIGCGCHTYYWYLDEDPIEACEYVVKPSCTNYSTYYGNYCCVSNDLCINMIDQIQDIPAGFQRGKCLGFETPVPCDVISKLVI